jgi:NAD(P)H-flavin reductase
VTRGTVAPRAHASLKQAWRAQGYILSCQTPISDELVVEAVEYAPWNESALERAELVSESVARVFVRAPAELAARPGQFVQLRRQDGLIRPYSIAARHEAGRLLELHVAVRPRGGMSQWLAREAPARAQLWLRGPFGECFYTTDTPEQTLILAGTGTGLAPLWAVLHSALEARHTGPIWLYHGSRSAGGLYLWRELEALAARHTNLSLVGCVSDNAAQLADVHCERLEQRLCRDHPKLSGARVFLCGNPQLVKTLKRAVYLAGASLDSIHSDPFVSAQPAWAP